MENSNIILIPVYKENLSSFEETSFRQCCKIHNSHKICLITFDTLDCTNYQNIAKEHSVFLLRENFSVEYFSSISGYNRLMLSKYFYTRFNIYTYILIYHLDAYVFRDDLDYWCSKGFDYIGAPWFYNFGSHESGDKLWKVGNGGLSLSKTKSFVECLSLKHPYSSKYIISKYYKRSITSLIITILHIIGYKNNYNKFWQDNRDLNEDYIFGVCMGMTKRPLKVASIEDAMKFSFDRSPQYLHFLISVLPFGCHTWHKNYSSFWPRYIPLNKSTFSNT